MSNSIASFFKRKDQLSSNVNLNYKGESKFGTICGGCVSLLTSCFFTVFIITQLFGWLFNEKYNQVLGSTYLENGHSKVYNISTQ